MTLPFSFHTTRCLEPENHEPAELLRCFV